MIHCKHKRSRTPLVTPSLEKYFPSKILYLSFQNYATDNKIFRKKYYLLKLHNISTTHIKSLPSSKLYLQISHLRQLALSGLIMWNIICKGSTNLIPICMPLSSFIFFFLSRSALKHIRSIAWMEFLNVLYL